MQCTTLATNWVALSSRLSQISSVTARTLDIKRVVGKVSVVRSERVSEWAILPSVTQVPQVIHFWPEMTGNNFTSNKQRRINSTFKLHHNRKWLTHSFGNELIVCIKYYRLSYIELCTSKNFPLAPPSITLRDQSTYGTEIVLISANLSMTGSASFGKYK